MWQSLTDFPLASLFGGMLLGISASLLLLFNGKIAGISGIISGVLPRTATSSSTSKSTSHDRTWRWLFLFGMVAGGLFAAELLVGELLSGAWSADLDWQNSVPTEFSSSTLALIIAGLLVGAGTKLGNGCTSGHGICGIGRLSMRPLVATITFMLVAAVTVYFRLHVFA